MQVFTAYTTFTTENEVPVRQQSYFQAILYIVDAALLIHVIGNIDDSLLIVVFCPFYREAW